ncbi:MAG: tRNA(Met) cytidine acetyltransferase [Zhongshania sp.]|jgi:tRNA(Met) cytidine acetyltransferase
MSSNTAAGPMDNKALSVLLDQLTTTGRHSGHRYLVFISGPQTWCYQQLSCLRGGESECLLLADKNIGLLSPQNAKDSLGQEFANVLIDGFSTSNANDWLAAAGTLKAGGGLFFLCPDFDLWPNNYLQASLAAAENFSRASFIGRLMASVGEQTGVFRWDAQQGLSGMAVMSSAEWQQSLPTCDQEQAVAAIRRVVTGRAKRPLVLRSDRGRGKTTSLGLAVAELFTQNIAKRILITAPNYLAVAVAFQHLSRSMPLGHLSKQSFTIGEKQLQFLSLEDAVQSTENWDLVLVDEAAVLPVVLLQTLLSRFSRLVFATTVHGYEGSGRGFDIRFKAILDEQRPQWRRTELQTPIRWAANDPLERTLNQIFLLDAEPLESNLDAQLDFTTRILNHHDLADENLLRQVFGLLVQAHYQTTPRDLQYLLDGPSELLVAESEGRVLGVCQMLWEGGFDQALAAEVIRGDRRPRGHLVAQRLAHISAESDFVSHRSLRINRIAVVANQRRRGLGRALLAAAERFAGQNQAYYLSSSFAADKDVVSFWLAAGFLPVNLGSRRDSASGLLSLIVVKAFAAEGQEAINLLTKALAGDLPLSLASVHHQLSSAVLRQILGVLATAEPTARDLQLAARYCCGEVFFEQAAAALARLCCQLDLRRQDGMDLAYALLLLGHDWSRLADEFKLDGRGAVEHRLRALFSKVLT